VLLHEAAVMTAPTFPARPRNLWMSTCGTTRARCGDRSRRGLTAASSGRHDAVGHSLCELHALHAPRHARRQHVATDIRCKASTSSSSVRARVGIQPRRA
jgi:hypothetical protein